MRVKFFYNIFFIFFCFFPWIVHVFDRGIILSMKLSIILALIGIPVIYLLPSIVAVYGRKHENALSILVFNFFLGWTIIGWIAAFIWGTYYSQPKDINANIKIKNVDK